MSNLNQITVIVQLCCSPAASFTPLYETAVIILPPSVKGTPVSLKAVTLVVLGKTTFVGVLKLEGLLSDVQTHNDKNVMAIQIFMDFIEHYDEVGGFVVCVYLKAVIQPPSLKAQRFMYLLCNSPLLLSEDLIKVPLFLRGA